MLTQYSIQSALRDAANQDVWDIVGAGAPTSGTTGSGAGITGPGSSYTDVTNKLQYLNTNTKASPTWTLLSSLPNSTNYKALAASATFTSTTVQNALTGFSWSVVPGTYLFEFNLPATMTTNGGMTVTDILTTAVLASLQAQSYAATASDNTTAVSTQVTATATGTKFFDSKTAAYTLVNIKGSMVVSTAGTFALAVTQNTSNTDTTTVLLGAFGKLDRVL